MLDLAERSWSNCPSFSLSRPGSEHPAVLGFFTGAWRTAALLAQNISFVPSGVLIVRFPIRRIVDNLQVW